MCIYKLSLKDISAFNEIIIFVMIIQINVYEYDNSQKGNEIFKITLISM